MGRKTILLIADEPKTVNSVKELLKRHYHLEVVKGAEAAAACLAKKLPELIIIDFELRAQNGLQVFKELGTSIKVIMLSASNNVPLVVSATKQGVAEFLRKPVDGELLLEAVEKNIARPEIRLRWPAGQDWLVGGSPALQKMLAEIRQAIGGNKHIILAGEPGSEPEAIASFIHSNCPRRQRKLAKIDLAAFGRGAREAHFWAALQELLAAPAAASLRDEADRCGTILLTNCEAVTEHFRLSIFRFFSQRGGKTDKSVRAVISLGQQSLSRKLPAGDFIQVRVPPLRERKEDLPHLLQLYLKRSSLKHGKEVRFISAALLEFLAAYDYPGNYLELEKSVEEAVLLADKDKLELGNFPLDQAGLLAVSLARAERQNLSLTEARRGFEKELYAVLLKKTRGESAPVAEFLDVPRAVLAQRLEDLLD